MKITKQTIWSLVARWSSGPWQSSCLSLDPKLPYVAILCAVTMLGPCRNSTVGSCRSSNPWQRKLAKGWTRQVLKRSGGDGHVLSASSLTSWHSNGYKTAQYNRIQHTVVSFSLHILMISGWIPSTWHLQAVSIGQLSKRPSPTSNLRKA